MPLLHDPTTRESLRSRLQALQPGASRQWGKMTVDQMLKHLNIALGATLGRNSYAPLKMPMPGPLFRFGARLVTRKVRDQSRRDFGRLKELLEEDPG